MTAPFRSSRDVIVRTEALSDAETFYTSVLGFETGSFCLYVESGASHGPVFEFLVPDVGAAKARLLCAGCVLIEEDPSVPRC
jgi:hypothetical protein